MYILGISGSPRKGGLSDSLLEGALDGARSEGCHVEKIVLSDLDIRPCQDCGGCADTARCVIRDGMDTVRAEIELADGIIIASPIYFGSITAQLKAAIDRHQDAWVAKYVLKNAPHRHKAKKGVFLCIAGEDKARYFANAKEIITAFFATLGIEYSGELFLGASEALLNDDLRRDEAMKRAFELGSSLARSL